MLGLPPWPEEPPQTGPDAVDSGVPQGEPGVKAEPRLSGEVRAAAEMTVGGTLDAPLPSTSAWGLLPLP